MGIDSAFALQLLQTAPLVAGKSNAVMLGRQSLALKRGNAKPLKRALAAAKLSKDLSDYAQDDNFAENFLNKIGYPPMKSMDASSYEACDYNHDLNDPLPNDLRGAFDVVIDGGTIEHVFNTPRALDNVFHMLADDGIFISINGMQGWAGHGFYQFSPELVWRYWQDARNCTVHTCTAVPIDPAKNVRDAPDTGKGGARFRARGMEGRWYLYYVVGKSAQANRTETITRTHQGDYVVQWERADACEPREKIA